MVKLPWVGRLGWMLVGALGVYLLADLGSTGPDLSIFEALRDSLASAQAQATRDSACLAAKDDTLAAYKATVETVTVNARLIVSAASRRATVASRRAAEAQAEVRAVLDSLGASTAALDTMAAAHAQEIAAKDAALAAQAAEIVARDRERAILWRRVELSDTVIADLRAQLARQVAVDAERARIEDRLRHDLRGAKIRERIAEGVAVAALTWKVIG